jgi:hypothetical protein
MEGSGAINALMVQLECPYDRTLRCLEPPGRAQVESDRDRMSGRLLTELNRGAE